MKRKIINFDKDEAGDWRAELECGHLQHVRHKPPIASRPWVLTEAGRREKLGAELDCVKCDAEISGD
jgi:tellurite methyltransferase